MKYACAFAFINSSAKGLYSWKKKLVKMENNFRKIDLCLIVITMSIFCAECRDPVLHRVGGGRYTWAPNINFKEWSSHEQFFVGDWLCKYHLVPLSLFIPIKTIYIYIYLNNLFSQYNYLFIFMIFAIQDFGFDKRLYNVLEVNKTSYDNCIDKDFIKNITRGGRDVFNLTEAKPYYFLSGRGYCFKGMKVAMLVLEYHSPPAVPNPASDICSKMIQLVLLGTALVCTLLFK